MEGISKTWHKILLILVKYVPFIIAIFYLICLIFGCLGIQLFVLPGLIYVSPSCGILILVMSKVLKFCIWHRLPIYYCFLMDVLSTIDYKYGILSNANLIIYMVVTIGFVLLGMCLKERYNRKQRFLIKNKS